MNKMSEEFFFSPRPRGGRMKVGGEGAALEAVVISNEYERSCF
jgi:hypothetical protein